MRVSVLENGCWEWLGTKTHDGYGQVRMIGQRLMAHRLCYELFNGKIDIAMQLDHLCRNRACINPAHLEQVTARENTIRGNTIQSANAKKTHCIRGHEFDQVNTVIYGGRRICRACVKSRAEEKRQNKETREMKRDQYRQGDVLIIEGGREAPKDAKQVPQVDGRTVLAYGEATGHHHSFGGKGPLLFRMDDNALTSYLTIDGVPSALQHQEHAEIVHEPGTYEVRQQRQWTLERQVRRVAD